MDYFVIIFFSRTWRQKTWFLKKKLQGLKGQLIWIFVKFVYCFSFFFFFLGIEKAVYVNFVIFH